MGTSLFLLQFLLLALAVGLSRQQQEVTDDIDGLISGKRKLIIDRDTKYCADFRTLIEQGGAKIIRLPPRSPNLNAYAGRFVRSIKEECLNRMIFFGEAPLRRAMREHVAHYHIERTHQGLANELIRRRARLGGLLSYYYREAA